MVNKDDHKKLETIRRDYTGGPLHKSTLSEDPVTQSQEWLKEAIASPILDPTAATLSTVSKEGQPSSRIILIKNITRDGLIFYSNYESHKAADIESNPQASLLFYWDILHRQLRIDGTIKKISKKDSSDYFQSRPLDSQIMASISKQSKEVKDRLTLDETFETAKKAINKAPLPLPNDWGGYILVPKYFEFWQGRESRLHDRIAYIKEDQTWKKKRLQP